MIYNEDNHDEFDDWQDLPLEEDAQMCNYTSNVATFKCKGCGDLICDEVNDDFGGDSKRGRGGRCEFCDNEFTFKKIK